MELRDKRYNDIRLIFHEEEHKYNDSLGNDYISTTTILHNYAPKFDKNYWLRKKSKELGISEKKLEEQWSTITKEACERGTNTHNGLEDGVGMGFRRSRPGSKYPAVSLPRPGRDVAYGRNGGNKLQY